MVLSKVFGVLVESTTNKYLNASCIYSALDIIKEPLGAVFSILFSILMMLVAIGEFALLNFIPLSCVLFTER